MVKSKSYRIIFVFALLCCFCLTLANAFFFSFNASSQNDIKHIKGVSLALSDKIIIKYHVADIPQGYSMATFSYEFGLKTYADTVAINGETEIIFSFDKVTPYTLNREIDVMLTLKGNDVETITETMTGFRVVDYVKRIYDSTFEELGLSNQEQYLALRSVVADLVNYGAKAQEYRGFNTANLATDSLSVEQKNDISEFVAPSETDTSFTGTESDKVAFRSATLSFGDMVDLVFKVYADDAKLGDQVLTLKVKKEDGEWENTVQVEKILHEDSDSVYVYTFEYQGLSVTEFNDVLTVQAYLNGTAEGKTLTYSVKSYVYSKVNDPESDPAMVELAKAIYCFANSVCRYINLSLN